MGAKPEIRVKLVTSPSAKGMTTDMFCRTFLGKSTSDFVRDVQIYGIDLLLDQAKKKSASIINTRKA